MKAKIISGISVLLVILLFATAALFALDSGTSGQGYAVSQALSSAAAATAATGPVTEDINKDETIYAVLNGDGSVASLHAVNHFYVPADGTYVDYGDYERVESLSAVAEPRITGDRIEWNLEASGKDFYYKGDLAGGELPWLFSISYTLDGVPISAQDLAGKSGVVEIVFTATINDKAEECFRNRYTMLIQVPVDLDRAVILSSDGATEVIAGRVNTLAYTVFPGTGKTFRIKLKADKFEMDSINIGLSLADYSGVVDAGEMKEGFEALGEGVSDLADGILAMQGGLSELADGVGGIADGLHELTRNAGAIEAGMNDYMSGLNAANESLGSIVGGSAGISGGLSELAGKGGEILGGYQQLAASIQSRLPTEDQKVQLMNLAQYAGNADPVLAQLGAMAQLLLEQAEGMEVLNSGINALNYGLSEYVGGVAALAQGYQGLDQGLVAFSVGMNGLVQGFAKIRDGNLEFMKGLSAIDGGMTELNSKVADLPDGALQLADGASSIKGGMDEANALIDGLLGQDSADEPIVSFASPDKGSVRSVQFIIRTPSISAPEQEKAPLVEKPKKGFLQKLKELFIQA
jgi:putative membrane protein